jgi:hypothetical protein
MSHWLARLRTEASLRRLIGGAVLGLCLALAQYGATVHELSHAVEASSQHQDSDGPAGHDELCVKCLAFAQVGHSIDSLSLHFLPASYSFAPPDVEAPAAHLAALRLAYFSTGPPSFS